MQRSAFKHYTSSLRCSTHCATEACYTHQNIKMFTTLDVFVANFVVTVNKQHQGLKSVIICANKTPLLLLTYLHIVWNCPAVVAV